MPDSGTKPGRWHRRRPVLLVGAIVVVLALIGGAAAWAAESSSSGGYRMGLVTRGSVQSSTEVTGTVEPVSQATVAFQVSGQVATLPVAVGDQVTAGQVLATLATTSLAQAVTASQSTVTADEAQLSSDEKTEADQASGSSAAPSSSSRESVTTTSSPASGGSEGTAGSGPSSTEITNLQQALVNDQHRADSDTQQESVDLSAEQAACSSPSSGSGSTPAGPGPTTPTSAPTDTSTTVPSTTASTSITAACSSDLAQVLADQQTVQSDQAQVETDENTLKNVLDSAGQSSASPSTPSAHVLDASGASSSSTGSGNSGNSGNSGTVTPATIDSDEAAIDGAQADLIEAQQSLQEAQLTTPVSGNIVSIDMSVGETVPAGSSTDVITIVGAHMFELTGSLTSTQVQAVDVGQHADVSVDGLLSSVTGSVTQVGPVSSTTSGISYPVVITLPADTSGLYDGSSAVASIIVSQASNVVTVPTSALHTTGTITTVEMLVNGILTPKRIVTGVVGDTETQVKSGLSPGQSVVLADLAEAVPSSSTLTGRFGGLGGAGGFGARFGGGGVVRFGGGGAGNVTVVGGAKG